MSDRKKVQISILKNTIEETLGMIFKSHIPKTTYKCQLHNLETNVGIP